MIRILIVSFHVSDVDTAQRRVQSATDLSLAVVDNSSQDQTDQVRFLIPLKRLAGSSLQNPLFYLAVHH